VASGRRHGIDPIQQARGWSVASVPWTRGRPGVADGSEDEYSWGNYQEDKLKDFTPDMIGKVVEITITQTTPKTAKRMTGRFPHESEVPGETETKVVSGMGVLSRVTTEGTVTYVFFQGAVSNTSLLWDYATSTVEVQVF
jgi:hypothetical protein